MKFVLVRKIYVEVDLKGTHPGLIDKHAFTGASSFSDLSANGQYSQVEDLQILRKDAMNLVYRYKLDQHTYLRVVEELIEEAD